jgi:mono/diheme cytochrome c family protein
MPKSITKALLLTGMTCAAFFCFAQQPQTIIKTVPIQRTSPVSGQEMYTSYCAACHGAKATGDGPAAASLRTPPPNLTLLSKKNGGTFPANRVMTVLQMGVASPAHGSPEMPIWGNLLVNLDPTSQDSASVVKQRIYNLTQYLKQVQK